MLEDIQKITQTIFDKFIVEEKTLNSPKATYDVYRALEVVISDTRTVAEHYLALTLEEDYLQNSSYGEPADKWRVFFNEDLKRLNKSVQEYLMKLYHLGLKDDDNCFGGFMTDLYNAKTLYSFIRDDYNVGFIEPCSLNMRIDALSTKLDNETYYLSKTSQIDLSTYVNRTELQANIIEKNYF